MEGLNNIIDSACFLLLRHWDNGMRLIAGGYGMPGSKEFNQAEREEAKRPVVFLVLFVILETLVSHPIIPVCPVNQRLSTANALRKSIKRAFRLKTYLMNRLYR
jgi:hypothetical protein